MIRLCWTAGPATFGNSLFQAQAVEAITLNGARWDADVQPAFRSATIDGGSHGFSTNGDTLIGPNANNDWLLTGAGIGTLGAVSFKNIESLTGGTGNDTFQFRNNSDARRTDRRRGGRCPLSPADDGGDAQPEHHHRRDQAGGELESLLGSAVTSDKITGANTATTWRFPAPTREPWERGRSRASKTSPGGMVADVFRMGPGAALSGTLDGGTGQG